jgi:hypothetical protein
MTLDTPIARFLLVLGLGFFFGLAFEEFHARAKQARPGGVRSFPLLALTGRCFTGWIRDGFCP